MEMLALLLVSAVALLVHPFPTNNPLNHVIEEASNYSRSLHQDYFVEDVTDLVFAECNATFFCKVQQILKDHHHKNKKDHGDMKVLRNLNVYISETKVDCNQTLKNVMKSDKSKPLPDLLENLIKCSRLTNFNGGLSKTSSPSNQ